MKDVIDVLQLQREKSREHPPVNYKDRSDSYMGARFIFECGQYDTNWKHFELLFWSLT